MDRNYDFVFRYYIRLKMHYILVAIFDGGLGLYKLIFFCGFRFANQRGKEGKAVWSDNNINLDYFMVIFYY